MKRLLAVVTALFVLSVVAAPFVHAADYGSYRGAATAAFGPNEQGEGRAQGKRPEGRGPRGGREGQQGRRGHPLMMVIMAVANPKAREDAALQALVDKAIAQCKKIQITDLAAIKAVEPVVEGFRAGKTREELKAEFEALKAAGEAAGEARKAQHETMMAIREKLKALRPEGAAGKGNRQDRRKGRKGQGEDVPPAVD